MQVQKQTKNAAARQSIDPIWRSSRQAWDRRPVANRHVRGLTRASRDAAVYFRTSFPFEQHRSPCRLSYQTTNQLKHRYIPYSGYFSGGKSFVSSEFLTSSWKNFRGHGILRVRPPNYAVLFRG